MKTDDELREMTVRVGEMGMRVSHQLADAIRGLVQRDDDPVHALAADVSLDHEQRALEELGLRLLARRAIEIADVRAVTTEMAVGRELARVGRLARSIAARTLELNRLPSPSSGVPDIAAFASVVHAALEATAGALARREPAPERALDLEPVYAKLLGELYAHMAANPAAVRWLVPVATVSSHLAQIGDHVGIMNDLLVSKNSA
jgi:phosphate transport system protein